MKKIAYKFILVISILVIFSLGALQILSTNIKSISSASTQILEKQVQDMTLLQKINLDFKEIHRLTVCHTMSTIDRTMDKYEKNIADLKEDVQENMAAYKARITDDKVQVMFSGLESKCELFLTQVDETIKVSAGGDKEAATISINNTLDTIVVNLDSYIENLTSTSNEEFEAREAELMATAKTSNSIIIFAMIFMVVAAIAIFFVANRMIVRPINMATKELQTITRSIQDENADLSKRLKIRTKDEISVLTSGINQFLEILESLIRNIRISSIRISEEQQEVFRCVEKTQDDANTTSCTMEELSAGMEDVTATVSLVTNHVKEAKDTVEKVSDDVREGFHFAEEMKSRADNLKQQAIESKHYAGEMMAGIDKALVQSVEDSRQINSITSLANEILGIASQTNLLALNASIEAARAGEAGKGFAVVADEIRQLADNSKTTANNIQQISQGVIESVSSLSENASGLLAFVNEKVMVDYDELENTGARYFNDATTVTDIINKISQGIHLINDTMKEVVESNESIAGTVEQNALGIGSVAVTTTELAENMREIVNALQQVQDVIDDLTRQAEIFRISDES